jgi:hypothetical protein
VGTDSQSAGDAAADAGGAAGADGASTDGAAGTDTVGSDTGADTGADTGSDTGGSAAGDATADASADAAVDANADAVQDASSASDGGGKDTATASDTGSAADSDTVDIGKTDTGASDAGGVDAGSSDTGKTDAGGKPGSCAGSCGGPSADGCYCDNACESFGDCCSDFKELCGCKQDSDCTKPGSTNLCETATCKNGICSSSKKSCPKTAECQIGTCNPATGNCEDKSANDGSFCSDNDKCTNGDACQAGKCAAGKSPTNCDDNNPCTADGCDPTKGCVHAPVEGSPPCDDGKVCTLNDACVAGKCTGAAEPDGTPCDDKNACSEADVCKAGVCDGKDLADGSTCDDGSACTDKDKCQFGFCSGSSISCKDDDPCTDDLCDKVTGCSNPPAAACDDGNACTLDGCKADAGKPVCSNTAIAEGAACNDSNPCTSNDVCTAGVCAGKALCAPLFSESFACGAAMKDWVLQPAGSDTTVGWAVDGLPASPGAKSPACSLNYNNNKNYDSGASNKGTATTGSISLPAGAKIQLSFWSYHGVEGSSMFDTRRVQVSADGFATTPIDVLLPNDKSQGKWTFEIVALDALAGKTVQIRFNFDSKDSVANSTPGWFVDDLSVDKL